MPAPNRFYRASPVLFISRVTATDTSCKQIFYVPYAVLSWPYILFGVFIFKEKVQVAETFIETVDHFALSLRRGVRAEVTLPPSDRCGSRSAIDHGNRRGVHTRESKLTLIRRMIARRASAIDWSARLRFERGTVKSDVTGDIIRRHTFLKKPHVCARESTRPNCMHINRFADYTAGERYCP